VPVLVAALTACGVLIGPVLRRLVVALAVPPGQTWRRACPACDRPLPGMLGRVRDLALAGRCPWCQARIGPPALSVEVTAAVLLGLLAARIHTGLVLAAMCWLAVCAIALAYIDVNSRRLPDVLTIPGYAGTVVLLLIAAAVGGHWQDLGRALAGGLAFAAFCLILLLISPSGMGMGDVKLAASLGTALAWLGWAALAAGALAGFVLAACYGVALLAAGRATRKTQVPFGPFMIAGTFGVLVIAGL
jgi:leader peptidase (prepilin peptidase) / N-methyltransferase